MPLTVAQRLSGDVTVIDLSGPLDVEPGPAGLREVVQEAAAGGARKILLNLKHVSFINAVGLGELASSHANAKHNGGTLKMTCLPKRVQELCQITGLTRVFDIYDDETDAIQSWQ